MSSWLIAVTGCIYLVVAIDLWMNGRHGLALAYLGYSFANVGLYLTARGQ